MREVLMLSDREETSRGLTEGLQHKEIACALERAVVPDVDRQAEERESPCPPPSIR